MFWLIGLFVRFGFAIILALIGLFLANKWHEKVGWKIFAGYYLFRLAAMAGLFFVMHQIPPDVSGWYQHALWMNEGYFPGYHFLSPYYLGFNFLLFGSVFIFNSPFSIIVLFTLVEAVALLLLFNILSKKYGEVLSKKVVILYLTSPIVTLASWFGAQDETILLLSLSIFLYIVFSNKTIIFAFILSLFTFFFTKVFALFYIQPFCLYKRWKSCFISISALAVYILGVKLFNIDPFCMRFGRGLGLASGGDDIANMVTPGSIWYLFPFVSPIVMKLCFVIGVGLATLFFIPDFFNKKKTIKENVTFVLNLSCVWYLVFNIFYPMTFLGYSIPIIPLLLLILHELKLKWIWAVFYLWSIVMMMKEQITSLPRVLNCTSIWLTGSIFVFECGVVLLSILLLAIILYHYHSRRGIS